MKKTLVVTLALVFVLGLAGTAFANPYSDVPAGHWAYGAVNDLYKAGVMEGAAGKFNGNQTLTRYEIAAITARAMAKADKADAATKATLDKLAVEFSSELNNLGVRVAKLEQSGGSSFKWTGDYRMRWLDADAADGGTSTQHRLRIAATAQVNDNTTAYVRIMAFNHMNLGQWQATEGDDMDIVDANVTVKDFAQNTDLTFGRFSHKLGTIGEYLDSTGKWDGVKAVVNAGDVKLTAAFADANIYSYDADNDVYVGGNSTEVATLQADFAVSKDLTLTAYYLDKASGAELKDSTDQSTVFAKNVTGFAAKYAFNPDWSLAAEFQTQKEGSRLIADEDADDLTVRLSYKGADKNKPGSWGAYVEYVDWEGNALDSTSVIDPSGRKMIGFNISNTLAKNVVFNAYYYDVDEKDGASPSSNGSLTRAQVDISF